MLRPCLLASLLLISGLSVAAQDLPRRIVSMNLCTDQLLLLLVEKNRIASLSYFASDPVYSALADQAAGIPANRGQADEIITFAPDLILTSQFSATLSANMLERMDYNVHRLGFAASLDDVYTQISEVAEVTGTQIRAASLSAKIQRDIATQKETLLPTLAGKSAVFFAANGFTYGTASLQDDFITSLGMRNIAAEAGISGPALLSIELLLAANPDFIFVDESRALDAQLAHPMLQHPALAALSPHTRMVTLPDTLFQCAGPQFALAYATFAEQLRNEN
ncbi:MAG: ABC transporter substrate-binding protein [Pseudomonadota bacterium]